jgi:hypothetical protein
MTDLFSSRSIRVFRFGLGILVAIYALELSTCFSLFYSEEGFFPNSAAQAFWRNREFFPHALNLFPTSTGGVAAVFALLGASGIALIGNVFPCWASLLAAILLWLLQVRSPLVTSSADTLLSLLCFWGALISPRDSQVTGIPGKLADTVPRLGYITQLCLIYLVSGWLKTDASWTENGRALSWVLANPAFAEPWVKAGVSWIPQNVFSMITFGVLGLERLSPLFFAALGFSRRLQAPVLCLFAVFHGVLGVALKLGYFPWLCLLAFIPLCPDRFWKPISRFNWIFAQSARSAGAESWGRLRSGVAFASLLLVLNFNWGVMVGAWDAVHDRGLPRLKALEGLAVQVGLDQRWNMFAPGPPEDFGRLRVVGRRPGVGAAEQEISSRVLGLHERDLDMAQASFRERKWIQQLALGRSWAGVNAVAAKACRESPEPLAVVEVLYEWERVTDGDRGQAVLTKLNCERGGLKRDL